MWSHEATEAAGVELDRLEVVRVVKSDLGGVG